MPSDIRVRIAPSPTGPLHIGTARTALFNALVARHTGGTFILRLEDTDVARSTSAFEKDILDGLHWLGITWDEGPGVGGVGEVGPYAPYRQMARLDLYAAAARLLLEEDRAYPCYCTPDQLEADRKAQEAAKEPVRYLGRCASLTAGERTAREADGRRGALRFRVRPGVVGWDDLVRDRVEIDTANLGGDFVIVRADGTPLYHFTVVVDDMSMRISHVIRGEDHVSNTPKHILLFEALGYPLPLFAHLPLILNPDGTKMSKRKSQTAVADYVAQGFLREALVNYFSFLGWSPGTEEDVLTIDEIADRFELDKVQKGAPASTGSGLSGSTASGCGDWTTRTWWTGCCRSSRLPASRARSTASRPRTSSGRCCRSCASESRRWPRSSMWRASSGRRIWAWIRRCSSPSAGTLPRPVRAWLPPATPWRRTMR